MENHQANLCMMQLIKIRELRIKQKINSELAKVYGKTGTAQICSNCDLLPHAWFAGFIEFKDKNYSIAIIIENGGKGSDLSSYIAGKIFKYIMDNDV